MLTDPTAEPIALTLKSETKDADFSSFLVDDSRIVLNIIDTPGLFETNTEEQQIRDNDTIISTIQRCVNRELTKFHLICFCVSVIAGINKEDVASLKLFKEYLGEQVSSNSCLIITRCELKDEEERAKIRKELEEDTHFKPIAGFFSQGVHFSGSLDYDAYKSSPLTLEDQFDTIMQDRAQLIQLLLTDIKPFNVSNSLISDLFQWQLLLARKQEEIDLLQTDKNSYINDIELMKNKKQEQELVIKKLKLEARKQNGNGCTIS
ncbi:unnamed protein product [Rotaria socialis]|uniref:AIG1-type G domain-containing protein n=1 Tax=Rotaria socialis TaxID=392032 RepID=A0A820U1Z2_9BILA|nr:unnamed protein product [Rotaria socialis]CAF4484524.1 unnamed protein product [Rotaria socialis]